MPYIDPVRRKQRARLDPLIDQLAKEIRILVEEDALPYEVAGKLNYAITRLVLRSTPIRRYWMFALLNGMLDHVRHEFNRRKVDPYEDNAKKMYGDIPEYEKD